MGNATLIETTESGRLAMTCGCGVTEKVRPRYAQQRKVFCGNCHAILQRPEGDRPTRSKGSSGRLASRLGKRSAEPRVVRSGVTQHTPAPWEPAERSRRATTSGWKPVDRPATLRDPSYERHIVAIGGWNMFAGVLSVLACVVGALLHPAALIALPIALAIFAVGYGLNRYSNVCRWLTVGLAGLSLLSSAFAVLGGESLLSVGLNVAWNVAIIAVLCSARASGIFTPKFRNVVARTPGVPVPWWSSPFFWIPAVVLLLALGLLVLGAGAFLALG